MHGSDWLPTLSKVAGYDLKGTLPLDGISQWSGISSGKQQHDQENDSTRQRTSVVLGNATNLCSWKVGDPRRTKYDGYDDHSWSSGAAGCGFGLRDGDWKIIQGYGGDPDDWCNTTANGRTCLNRTATATKNNNDNNNGRVNMW